MNQAAAYITLKVYENATDYAGIASVQLPSITYPVVNIAGAGMMGNMEVPLYGMVDAMSMTLNFLSPTQDTLKLFTPVKHQLDMRVVEEYWNVEQAEVGLWGDKFVVMGRPKNFAPGTITPMAAADTSLEMAVYYYAAFKDGKQIWCIDKRSMMCVINDVDYMAPVRRRLGMS